ncbi:hypothetical protein Glove_283g167 [Diversispora epigaea]|uniref:Uncharacterized protein n=1 Tax=Diversispora epigaea TaxID=1348612 RepID=A0A397I3B7_9GLOM|nr:hypothetical protein Glove_283g167 [Diversispora epigaea]
MLIASPDPVEIPSKDIADNEKPSSIESSKITTQSLMHLFKNAIRSGHQEILSWIQHLSGVTSVALRIKTLRGRKIRKLFGENRVGIDKVKNDQTKKFLPETSNVHPKLLPLMRKLSKKERNQVINKLTTHFTDSPKLDLYFSMDNEAVHQTDTYWVFGSCCPICREKHTSLNEPGIPLDDVLKTYFGNSELIRELKAQCFTLPILWNNALNYPDKSIAVEV